MERGFLHRLAAFGDELRTVGSRLVLTVTDELWAGHHDWSAFGVTVLHLTSPPNAQELVERHLADQGHADLVHHVRTDRAMASIRGRDAVEAMRCVATVVQQWRSSGKHRSVTRPDPGPVLRPVRLEALDSLRTSADNLQTLIEQALADWREHFDRLFGDPDGPSFGKEGPLSLPDRCLLLALAVRRAGPAGLFSDDALALESEIRTVSDGEAGSPTVATVFAGRGLRPRLLALTAEVDLQDRVVFDRPGYAEAVLGYVWDNFPQLHEVLLGWLVRRTGQGAIDEDPACRALVLLVLRHKDPKVLDGLKDLALRAGRTSLLAVVAEQALGDLHMGSSTWQLLTKWARQDSQVRRVVGDACRRVLVDERSAPSSRRMAMTRLRNLARTDDRSVRDQVLDVFDDAAQRPGLRPLLAREIENWLVREWPAHAGRLALLALMRCRAGALPWLLGAESPVPHSRLGQGLRELFADGAELAETVARTTDWLNGAAPDMSVLNRVLDQVAPALCGHHQAAAALRVLRAVETLVLADGTSVRDRLFGLLSPEDVFAR